MASGTRSKNGLNTVIALVTIYIIWGSTYLAIRFSVETIPPFLMAGARFLVAGIIAFAAALFMKSAKPTMRQWRNAAITGLFLLVGGNGLISFAEQSAPSSLAALLISTTPIWMTLLDCARPNGKRPTLVVSAGLLIGLIGVGILIAPDLFKNTGSVKLFETLLIPVAAVLWAVGSVFSRQSDMPSSPAMGTAIEMLAGGVALLIIGTLIGEWSHFQPAQVSQSSILALVYLIIFGSLAGYTAYIWLLNNTSLALTSTYAYVNPVVAVFLGVVFDNERLTPTAITAAIVIVFAIVLITSSGHLPSRTQKSEALAPAEN